MTTDLTVVSDAEIAALAAVAGADPSAGRGPRVPELKVNLDDEDADGNELPRGQFFLKGHDVLAFAKEVKIRPLTMHYQYSDYDAEAKKTRNRTVQNTAFNQEFYDQLGGIRCGKPAGKDFKNLSDTDKKKYESITCFRLVRCLVSYTGTDLDGNEVEIENVPAIVRLKGANFMPFSDEVEKKLPAGRLLWDFWSTVSLERLKNGSVTYYVLHFAPDFAAPAPMDRDTLDTIKGFAEMVERDNKSVYEAYKTAIEKRSGDAGYYDDINGDLGNDLDD